MKKEFRSFEDARKFVSSLNLKSQNQWRDYSKSGNKPKDIPSNPNQNYKNEWKSWGDFLGTGKVSPKKIQYVKFQKARMLVQSLGLTSQAEWKKYCNSGHKPQNIPAYPNQVYKYTGWKSMGDWLGTGTIAPKDRKYLSFNEAREIVHNAKLKSSSGWRKYCNLGGKPSNIPTHPHIIYKNKGWINWGDFFGTNTIATQQRKYLKFSEARRQIRFKKIKSSREWKKFTKDPKFPKNIPVAPDQFYKEWISMGDWLGTGTIAPQLKSKSDLSWKEAKPMYRKITKENKITSREGWRKYVKTHKLPKGLPPDPSIYSERRVRKMIHGKK